MSERNKGSRLRFSYDDDLELLRLVVAKNPYENNEEWKIIHKEIDQYTGKDFSVRALRERLQHLLKLFIKEDKTALKRSGTEEQYQEKERLLQEIRDLEREFNTKRDKVIDNKSSKTLGLQLRDNVAAEMKNFQSPESLMNEVPNEAEESLWMNENSSNQNLVEQSSNITSVPVISTPATNRKKRKHDLLQSDSLDFLKNRSENEMEIKKRELELDERKLKLEERRMTLDERKFEFEVEQRSKRLDMEIMEHTKYIKIMENQNNTLNCLISLLSNKEK